MKNLIFSLACVLFVVIITTSCNERQVQPDLKISLKADTLIYQKVPVTAPRYSCETGDRLSQDKLLGMDSVPVIISLKKDTIISGKNLLAPAKITKKSGAEMDLDWLWPILSGLLGIVLFLIALIALAYLLYKAFQAAFLGNNRNVNQNQQQHTAPIVPVVPVTPGGGQNQQPVTQPNQTDVFNHQISMAEGLIGKQRIHQIVQESKGKSNGSWSSRIEITTKNDPAV